MKYALCATMALALVATSCVTYTGVSKSPDGDLYISGGTSYFVYSSPWIRRCKVDDTKLECVELTEPSKQSTGTTGGTAAPASSSQSSAAAPAETPAPGSEPAKK